MSGTHKHGPTDAALSGVDRPPEATHPRRNFARWRALSLSLVYLVFAVHIIHWKLTGKTLAPLELNEVMYTLELGIITAGFLFMCTLALGTLLFGRFFCSWACHIMVLQDLCAWLLRKIGIRSKPIRSRVLLLVPVLTAFYMFIWPQIKRWWHDEAFPTFHFATDAEGWASFVTNNFWRNLPSPGIIALTFLVCGFLMVYLMGSRTFCTYVCPYGAIFALADRFSPGRVRVSDKCRQCGTCTWACTTGVRVHEEVKKHGMIVNPACLKDLDCVSWCPQQALSYGPSKPALFKSYKSGGRFGLPYDFTWREDIQMALVFVVVLLSFRGLYSRVPFLLSLALGGIIGYLSILAVRLFTRPNVMLSTLSLKRLGRLTIGGRIFATSAIALGASVAHSSFVRYHEYFGLTGARMIGRADRLKNGPTSLLVDLAKTSPASLSDSLVGRVHEDLLIADRWGLLHNERVERALLKTAFRLEEFETVDNYAARLLERYPNDTGVRLTLGQSLAQRDRAGDAESQFRTIIAQWGSDIDVANPPPALVSAHHALGELLAQGGKFAAAADEMRTVLGYDPQRTAVHAALGSVLAELGRFDAAVEHLQTAVDADPGLGGACYNLGTILAYMGRFDEAVPNYEKALAAGMEDAELHNNLGFALMRTGEVEKAGAHFRQAIAIDPENADAHFNLARILASQQEMSLADEHYRIAARLDPRYARLLSENASD
ncbi:MAG: tetratricopeptide repeat protein [Planctomycetota bacterium]|jgi:tetratricopeptide (TPR) repeat protein/polyferredoxin